MRKSTLRQNNYRSVSSLHADRLARFRKQMAEDYARGEVLVYLRKKKRLTQMEAAYESGISDRSIRSWEKDGPIKWSNAKRYAAFYGVDPESIVSRDLKPPVDPADIEAMKEQLKELLDRSDPEDGPRRAVTAAKKARKKSQRKSPGTQPSKVKKRQVG